MLVGRVSSAEAFLGQLDSKTLAGSSVGEIDTDLRYEVGGFLGLLRVFKFYKRKTLVFAHMVES